jgi:carbon starvation protein
MNALVLLLIGIVVLVLGYRFYSGWIARQLGLGATEETPAHTMRDGVDYVPAPVPVLLGHHFASIAGAAPIIGPILAAQFGWLPVLLWILLGGVFLGAVHDFTSLVASVRHQGRSIGILIETYLGRLGKVLFMLFAWATMILVIAVFDLVVSATFVTTPAVATASILFMVLAVGFGFAVYRARVNFLAASGIGVLLLGACLWLGARFPFPRLFEVRGDWDPMVTFWQVVLLVYVFIASVTPVHILLQPRDYLNSFLLYGILLLSVAAIVVKPPPIEASAFVAFQVDALGPLFPMLFVTVACGAISGFHSLVASGTSAKQLNREKDARPVGYGGMLIECLLAVVALITAIAVTREEYLSLLLGSGRANPVHVFSTGIASFLGSLGIPTAVGLGFAGLAVSAFALTSLDTATRLARFTLQELVMKPGVAPERQNPVARNRFLATAITIAAGGALLLSGTTMTLWKVFGSANQLLAALALMAVTVWLAATKRKSLYTFVPMVLMYAVTVSGLVLQLVHALRAPRENLLLLPLVVALLVLAGLLGWSYVRNRLRGRSGQPAGGA